MNPILEVLPAVSVVLIGLPAGWHLWRRHHVPFEELCILLVGLSAVAWLQAAQFAVFLAIFLALIQILRGQQRVLPPGPLDVPILCYLVFALLAGVFGTWPVQGLLGLKSLFVFALVPLLSRQPCDPRKFQRSLTSFLIGGILGAIVHGIRFLSLAQERASFRAGGAMSVAGLMLVLAAFCACFLLEARHQHPKRGQVAFLLVLSTTLMILQFKRGVWLAALGCLLLFGLFLSRKFRIACAFAAVMGLALSPLWLPHATAMFWPLDDSSKIRLDLWGRASQISLEYPAGIGQRTERYLIAEIEELPHTHFHNNFVNVAVTAGVAGLLAWCWWLIRFFSTTFETWKNLPAELGIPRGVCLGSLAATLAWLIAGCFEFNFGDSRILLLILWCMGVSLWLQRFHPGPPPVPNSEPTDARPGEFTPPALSG